MGTRNEYARFEREAGEDFDRSKLPREHPYRGFYKFTVEQKDNGDETIRKFARDVELDEVALAYADDDIKFRDEYVRIKLDLGSATTLYRKYLATLPEQEEHPVEIEAAAVIEEVPYPLEVWEGTLYGLFAACMTKENFIPREFCIEALKTCVGAVVGDRVRGDFKGINMRQLTVLIGIPGKGKGDADRSSIDIFRELVREVTDGLKNPDFISAVPVSYKHIGAMLTNPASDVGLIDAAKLCPRLLHHPSEIGELFSKMRIENNALPSVMRELYDSVYITPSTTAKRKQAAEQTLCHYSLLSTTQPDAFTSALSLYGGIGTGFASRLTLVRNEEKRTVAALRIPDYGDLPKLLFAMFADAEERSVVIKLTAPANNLLNEWWATVNSSQREESDEIRTRVNIIVLRNSLHLAWLRSSSLIEVCDMERAIKLGNYQLAQRRALILPATDNVQASHQMKIISFIERNGPASARQIYQGVSGWRVGSKLHNEALDGLWKGEHRILLKKPTTHVNSFVYALIKHSEDE